MKRKKAILIFTIIVSISSGLFLYVRTSSPLPLSFSSDKNVFLKCEIAENKSERYDCYKQAALSAMQKGRSVKDLAQYALDHNSHLKHHAIGRAILIVSDYNLESARKKCMPECDFATYHAFAQVWGEYAPSRENELIDFLKDDCPVPAVTGCYHIMGHFYMSAHKNFEQVMARCDTLQDNRRFYHCVKGVVHEQFFQSDGENFFQLCKNYTGRRKTACFLNASRIHPMWFSEELTGEGPYPLKVCDQVSGEIPVELNSCYARAAWILENKGKTLDLAWCEHLNAQLRELCQKGLQAPVPDLEQ